MRPKRAIRLVPLVAVVVALQRVLFGRLVPNVNASIWRKPNLINPNDKQDEEDCYKRSSNYDGYHDYQSSPYSARGITRAVFSSVSKVNVRCLVLLTILGYLPTGQRAMAFHAFSGIALYIVANVEFQVHFQTGSYILNESPNALPMAGRR